MSNETKPGAVDSILEIWQLWNFRDMICADDAMVMMRPHMEAIAEVAAEQAELMKAADEFELRRLLAEERETNRQLIRALAEATDGPTFMGEPVLSIKPINTSIEMAAWRLSVWERFPGYLIDNCEGETITEEGLQRSLADMLKDPKYAIPTEKKAAA